jgi:hypothetical protein
VKPNFTPNTSLNSDPYPNPRPHGRIAVCGEIAEYSAEHPNLSSISLMKMIYTFQRIEGFVCGPWLRLVLVLLLGLGLGLGLG